MTDLPLRALEPADAEAGVALILAANAAAERAAGREPQPVPDERRLALERRLARFPETDGPGCHAIDGEDGLVGFATSVRRGPLWGLSLLFVHPDHQSRRLGSRLLAATLPHGEGAAIEVIMASDDHRALRRYASLGLDLHPGMSAKGTVDRSRLPADLPVRAGDQDDLELVAAVDRRLRGGSSRADDIAFLIGTEADLHVVDRSGRRGYVVEAKGTPICLGATDVETAQHLLWAALAQGGEGEVELWGLTGSQQWAFAVLLAAGLRLEPGGAMFWRGLVPPVPYLPSGVYF